MCSNAVYYTDCMQSPVSRPSLLHDLHCNISSPPSTFRRRYRARKISFPRPPLFPGGRGGRPSVSPPSAVRFPEEAGNWKDSPKSLSRHPPSIFGCNLGKLDRKVEGFLEWGDGGERRSFCMASDAASPIACGGETIVSLFLFSARAEEGLLLFSGREKKIAQWLLCLSWNSLTGIASLLCLLNDATMVHCTT